MSEMTQLELSLVPEETGDHLTKIDPGLPARDPVVEIANALSSIEPYRGEPK